MPLVTYVILFKRFELVAYELQIFESYTNSLWTFEHLRYAPIADITPEKQLFEFTRWILDLIHEVLGIEDQCMIFESYCCGITQQRKRGMLIYINDTHTLASTPVR